MKGWWDGDRHTSDPEMGEEGVVGQILSVSSTFIGVKIWKDEADLRTVRSSQRSINFESENTEYVCY